MAYVEGVEREQVVMFPEVLDDYIDPENPVRFVERFVNQLDLEALGIAKAAPARRGRPAYDPRDLLKLYIYGYVNEVRSSRKLERESKRNLEVMWLLRKLSPDHKTIANFRKDNHQALPQVFRQFTRLCRDLELYGRELIGVDGSKFRAVNGKDRNFTEAKLAKRLQWIEEKIAKYLKALAAADASESQEGGESAESMAAKLQQLEQRQLKYEGWQAQLAASGEGQISLTDEESRLMKSRQGQHVSYNVQIAVDSKHKLIADFAVTNEENDVNCLAAIAKGAQRELGVEQLQVCADKGYYNSAQIKECEEAQLSVYMERPRAKQVAGIFPLGQFRYDASKDVYECPAGQSLRYRHTDKQKQVKLYWTKACHQCPLKSQCTSAKEARKISRPLGQEAADRMLQRVAQQPQILELRKQLVEHPFGSIKRGMNQGHFLLRGKAKVTGESSLTFLAYNLKRALNVVGLEKLMGGLDKQTGRKALAQTARAAFLWSQSPAVAKCLAGLNVRSPAGKKLKLAHYFDWRIKTAFALSVS